MWRRIIQHLVPIQLAVAMTTAAAAPVPVPADLAAAGKARRYLGYIKVSPTGEALRQATAEGRPYTIDLLLTAGVPVDAADAGGNTPLMVAAKTGDVSTVTKLLRQGAAIDAVNGRGETALVLALGAKDDRAFHTLLDEGAAVDVTDHAGERALHHAVREKRAGLVEALLQAGARVSMPGDARPPLELAWQTGDPVLIRSLIERGAPPLEWNAETSASFWEAYRKDDDARLDLFQLSHQHPPSLTGDGQPLLAEAVLWRDADLVQLLLKWGADPNTALVIPATGDFIRATGKPDLSFYLEKEQGMTVLMLAAGLGWIEGVEVLMEAGASRTASTEHYKMVAQSFAGRTGNAETLQVLLGCSPKPEDQEITVRISISTQMATIYKKGVPWVHTSVSTGRKQFPTPPGRYVITDKHRKKISTIYDVPMPYFMRLSGRDFGMHEGYVPGYAASHGCIRLPAKVARQLYQVADVGTLVTIDE